MTEPSVESPRTDDQLSGEGDPELAAIQAILVALTKLRPEQRQRVIDYVFQRLGLETAQPSTSPPPPPPAGPAGPINATSAASIRDVRSLKEQKKPRTANEMATLVAYYLSELAPEGGRKSEIGIDDITTYFKQAGYPLPAVLRNTLVNAKAAGYFDSASHGQYKLNPVGHNLVVHGLPATGDDAKSGSRAKRNSRKPSAKSKGTKRR
ncbi:MAG: hypothetical protein JWM02_3574 [Frankiales bacterium]|nr:hypothetical protein [Frankiales bacterium]